VATARGVLRRPPYVMALDMASCGDRPGSAEEVRSFEEYGATGGDSPCRPQFRQAEPRAGHGSEKYPDRVAVAVFVSPAMPTAG
jgi:hypothetical protein